MSGTEISQKLVFFYTCEDCGHSEVDLMGSDNPFGMKSLVCQKCGGKMIRVL